MKKHSISIFVTVLGLLVLAIPAVGAIRASNHVGSHGAVYIMTNDPAGNQVVVYQRAADGSLTLSGSFATGGVGIASLAGTNQGGLVLSNDGRWLIVANAGSDTISAFRVENSGLKLTDTVSSSGKVPISVTVSRTDGQQFGEHDTEDHSAVVYVLDNGTSTVAGNIAGFSLTENGKLSLIDGSAKPLGGTAPPAQISFNPTGRVLVVTEKGGDQSTSIIDTYTVNSKGVASGPITHPSSGVKPFGFAFDGKGRIFVSEAAGGLSGSGVSSYAVTSTGAVATISASVGDTQLAACWEVVTGNGRYTYTADAHSGTISSYTIHHDGSITLLKAIAADTRATDLDMALSGNSHFLYVFVHGSNSIQGYSVHSDGSLELVTTVTGIAATADGLAAI